MMMRWTVFIIVLLWASPSLATTRYLAPSPTGDDNNTCAQSESISTPKATISSAKNCMTAGDELQIAAGTYNQSFNITGLAGSASTLFRFVGAPGGTSTFLAQLGATSCRSIISSSTTNGVIIENIKFSGTGICPLPNGQDYTGNRLDGASNVTLKSVEIVDFTSHSIYIINATNIFIDGSSLHGHLTDCVPQYRYYALYIHSGNTNINIWNNDIYENPGGGMQFYPGGLNGGTVLRNRIHHNSSCESTPQGGITVLGDSTSRGPITNLLIADNWIYKNNDGATSGSTQGVKIGGAQISNVQVIGNVIYNNRQNTSTGIGGDGVLFLGSVQMSGMVVKNNIITANEDDQIDLGNQTGVTVSHNACTSVESCGSTGKATITSIAQCVVDADADDYRLLPGTNPCRDVGTLTTARPAPVGTTDIGATEQGLLASSVVVGSLVEVTVNVMTPGVVPTSGITGFTLACVTCTGTPVIAEAVVKAGSNNIIQLSISGLTASGTATLSYNGSTGNLKDSGYVGPVSLGYSQIINTISGLAISGTVDNTDGTPAPPAGGLYSEFLLDEGAGTTATDNTANLNHGTVSTGVTWVNDTSGTGVYIPTAEEAGDSTYRAVTSTYGASIDPTTESFSACMLVLPDTQYAQKIPLSTGDYSSNRRAYLGWVTIGGVKRWGIGVQGSSFSTAATEFPLEATLTLACMRFNAATDTANLSINRTIGTSSAANKTYTSFTTTGNIRAGSDSTFTVNTGGVTIYGVWVWNNTYISDANVQALYDSIFPAGGSVGGYAEVTHRWQEVYVNGSDAPINLRSIGTTPIKVVACGAVAIEFQVNCTGGACGPLAVRLHASDVAGNTGAVPQELDAFGLATWSDTTSDGLNKGTSTCCLSGALTAVDGITVLGSVASNTIELAENSSTMFRFIVRVACDQEGEVFSLFLKQDNGAALDGAAGTTPQIEVIGPSSSGGP